MCRAVAGPAAPQEQELAALTIQRHYRGHAARKRLPPHAPYHRRRQQRLLGPAGRAAAVGPNGELMSGATPDQQLAARVRFQEGQHPGEARRVGGRGQLAGVGRCQACTVTAARTAPT